MTTAATVMLPALTLAVLLAGAMSSAQAGPPAAAPGQGVEHARIVEHWTPARRAAATPRDLVIDERGYGYLKLPNGALQPYGHSVAAAAGSQRPMAKPGTGDTTGPTIGNRDPGVGATVTTTAYSFKATVTDSGGVRTVSFRVGPRGGLQSAFTATAGPGGVYTANLTGLADGTWTWSVVARDNAGNTTTTPLTEFTVSLGSGGGGGGGSNGTVVTNSAYTGGGKIQNAVGRIYFEMPSNSRRTRWAGYVCSGTVVADATGGRSVIQTAAHCVYDDAYKAYARNVLFIPNQDGTTGAGTDRDCANDPLGCWTMWFGVVDSNWTTRTFPANIPWDYAYYVVKDSGAHTAGIATTVNPALDVAVPPIGVNFTTPPTFDVANSATDYATALGYSYSDDPNFMYCAEDLSQYDSANWRLPSCGLSGGSSGGPWMQPFSNGDGSLVSVNSWGYTSQPGMYGPKLSGTSASCVFARAKAANVTTTVDGDEGSTATCP